MRGRTCGSSVQFRPVRVCTTRPATRWRPTETTATRRRRRRRRRPSRTSATAPTWRPRPSSKSWRPRRFHRRTSSRQSWAAPPETRRPFVNMQMSAVHSFRMQIRVEKLRKKLVKLPEMVFNYYKILIKFISIFNEFLI